MPAIQANLTEERYLVGALPSRSRPRLHHGYPDRRDHASREQLLDRIRAEFDELQGLKLTFAQARRLFGLREDVCIRVLKTLIHDGLLCCSPSGDLYARRRSDG